jgi:hypothetical protein
VLQAIVQFHGEGYPREYSDQLFLSAYCVDIVFRGRFRSGCAFGMQWRIVGNDGYSRSVETEAHAANLERASARSQAVSSGRHSTVSVSS